MKRLLRERGDRKFENCAECHETHLIGLHCREQLKAASHVTNATPTQGAENPKTRAALQFKFQCRRQRQGERGTGTQWKCRNPSRGANPPSLGGSPPVVGDRAVDRWSPLTIPDETD
jgi:hypothetical protein